MGRLVTKAADVSHMLDVYTANNGQINPRSSLVTGYDFVADAATNAAADLSAGLGTTPDSLISPEGQSPSTSWTAADLQQKLLGSRHDIVFMAGHFSAGGLEAADYSTSLSAATVASSSVDMSNTLVLALGCHGGYNIPPADGVSGLSPSPDWTEAFAEKGATLLASTGYAYGDTVLTEYGEHLFDNFVHQLRVGSGAVAVGSAEIAAKKDYLLTHPTLTGVDEKTLLETTLYGLPMEGVDMPSGRISPASDNSIVNSTSPVSTGSGSSLGLATSDVDVTPTLTSHQVFLNSGQVTTTYLTGPNDGEVARPGEPIFPAQSYNVHVPSFVLRGVGFRGGSYSDTPNITPLTSAAGTETSVGHPAFYTNVLYPTQVGSASYLDALSGGPERLDTTPAQYVSSGPASTSGTLRQFSDLKFRLFYLPNGAGSGQAAQAAPSQITDVSTGPYGTEARRSTSTSRAMRRQVRKPSGSRILTRTSRQVAIRRSHPGSAQIRHSGAQPRVCRVTPCFMVQAANGAGLVTLSTNSGSFYTIGARRSTTPSPTTLTVQSAPSTGVYQTPSSSFQMHLRRREECPSPVQAVTLQIGSQQAIGTTDQNGDATISRSSTNHQAITARSRYIAETPSEGRPTNPHHRRRAHSLSRRLPPFCRSPRPTSLPP